MTCISMGKNRSAKVCNEMRPWKWLIHHLHVIHAFTCRGQWSMAFWWNLKKREFVNFLFVSTSSCHFFDCSHGVWVQKTPERVSTTGLSASSKGCSSCLLLATFIKFKMASRNGRGWKQRMHAAETNYFFNSKQTKSIQLKDYFLFPIVNHI